MDIRSYFGLKNKAGGHSPRRRSHAEETSKSKVEAEAAALVESPRRQGSRASPRTKGKISPKSIGTNNDQSCSNNVSVSSPEASTIRCNSPTRKKRSTDPPVVDSAPAVDTAAHLPSPRRAKSARKPHVCKKCNAEHDGGFNDDYCSQACLNGENSEQTPPGETPVLVPPAATAPEPPVEEPTPEPAADTRSRPRRDARSSPSTATAAASSIAVVNSLGGDAGSGSPRGSSAGGSESGVHSSSGQGGGSGKKTKRAAAAAAAAQPPSQAGAASVSTPRQSKAASKAAPKSSSKAAAPQATAKVTPKATPKATPTPRVYRDPALAKLSKVDAKMMSKRRVRDAVSDVPYDFELVPACVGASLRPWPPETATSAATASGAATEAAKGPMEDDAAPENVVSPKAEDSSEALPMQETNEAAAAAAAVVYASAVADAPVADGDGARNAMAVASGEVGEELLDTNSTSINQPGPQEQSEEPQGAKPPTGMLAGSVLVKVYDREVWAASLTELLLLCSEAAWRRVLADRRKANPPPLLEAAPSVIASSSGDGMASNSSSVASSTTVGPTTAASSVQQEQPNAGVTSALASMMDSQGMLPALTGASGGAPDAKPLTLEYMADRLDTDDPTWGYMVRQESTGWLQGFVLLTDFTTWSSYFRFDSTAASTGITADDWSARRCDRPTPEAPRGALATLLDAEPRWGDPFEEGVVFRRVAEVSLLGGLGCGAWLLHLALQDCKKQGYKYAVLQATDQAIPFYEQMGFVRVGCVARHAKDGDSDNGGSGQGPGGPYKEEEPNSSATGKGAKSSKPLAKGLAAGLEPPPVPLEVCPEDGYYWLAQWMAFLCEQFKLLDEDQVFCVAVDEREVPNYRLVCPFPPVDLGLMGRKAVANRYEALPDLVGDLHALVTNALTYNAGNSPIYRRAKKLRAACLNLVSTFVSEWPQLAAASRTMAPVVWPERCWLTPPEPPAPTPPKAVASSTVVDQGAVFAAVSADGGMEVENVADCTVAASAHGASNGLAVTAGAVDGVAKNEGGCKEGENGGDTGGSNGMGNIGAVAATEAPTKASTNTPTIAETTEPKLDVARHSPSHPEEDTRVDLKEPHEQPPQSSTSGDLATGVKQADVKESNSLPSTENKAEELAIGAVGAAAEEAEGALQGDESLVESGRLHVGDIVSARYGNGLTWYTDCRIFSVNVANEDGARGGRSGRSAGSGSASSSSSSSNGAETPPAFTYGVKYNNGSKRSSVQREDIRLTERTPEGAANEAAAAQAAAQAAAVAASGDGLEGVDDKTSKEKGGNGRPRTGPLTSVTRALAIPSGVSFAAADGPRKRGRPRTAEATSLEPLSSSSLSPTSSSTNAAPGSSGKKRGPKKGKSKGKKPKAARLEGISSPSSTSEMPEGEQGINGNGTTGNGPSDETGADSSSSSSLPWAGGFRDAEEAAHVAWLQTPSGEAFAARLAAAADRDTRAVLGYVHWTFPDQTVEDQYPSYMMARTLDDLPSGDDGSSSSSSLTEKDIVGAVAQSTSASGNSWSSSTANDHNSSEARESEAGSAVAAEAVAAVDVGEEAASPVKSTEGVVPEGAEVKEKGTSVETFPGAGRPPFKVGLSPEMAAGFPRGVTPRGATFVAKFGGDEYLGSFPTPEEAEAAYQDSLAYHRQHRQAKDASGSNGKGSSSNGGASRLSAGSDGAKTPKKGQSKKAPKYKGKGRSKTGKGAKKGASGGAAEDDGNDAAAIREAGDATEAGLESRKDGEGAEDEKMKEGDKGHKQDDTQGHEVEDDENAVAWPPPPLPRPVDPSVNLIGCAHRWLVEDSPPVVPHRMAWGLQTVGASSSSSSSRAAPSVADASSTNGSSTALAVAGEEDGDLSTPSTKKAKKTATASTPGKKAPALYNKVVAVQDLPPCYPNKYWFVYQYVPDMQWCHLCPLYVDGTFKTGPRMGCPRYKLCPEGRAREVDVPASRCTLVEARQCVHSASADKEVFDIPEEAADVK